jgi:hypothetical protein
MLARETLAARHGPVEEHAIAGGDILHSRAHGQHDARPFVAHDHRRPAGQHLQVGVTHAAGLDRDQHLAGAGLADAHVIDRVASFSISDRGSGIHAELLGPTE